MKTLMQGIERFWKDEEGAEVVEWVLVCALIVAAFLAGYAALGGEIVAAFQGIVDALGLQDAPTPTGETTDETTG